MSNGILNIYKPQHVSSNFVVIAIKKKLGIKKIGHTGTLDPLACGVLPICVGSGTKISEYLINKDKVYRAKLKFGFLTDTYDLEGKVIKRDNNVKIKFNELNEVLKGFICEYEQLPPIYSAIKINGKKAYELAREGSEVNIKPRNVKIYSIDEINYENNECSFLVKCSKGTYIRSLCKDIGDKLNTYATMTFLERVESGIFKKENSISLEELTKENINKYLIPIDKSLSLPPLNVDDEKFYKLLINGVCIKNPKYIKNIDIGTYFLYNNNTLKGICKRNLTDIRIVKIF